MKRRTKVRKGSANEKKDQKVITKGRSSDLVFVTFLNRQPTQLSSTEQNLLKSDCKRYETLMSRLLLMNYMNFVNKRILE